MVERAAVNRKVPGSSPGRGAYDAPYMIRRADRLTWLVVALGLFTTALVVAIRVSRHLALGELTSLAVSSDGSFVAAGHRNGRVTLWNPATGERTATIRSDKWGWGTLENVVISHDKQWIASVEREGNEEGTIHIFEAGSGSLVDCLRGGDSSTPVAFHPRKPWLAWVKGESISIWDASARKEVRRLAPRRFRASAFAFSPEGQHLALGVLDMEGVPGNENVVLTWDVERDRLVSTFKGLESFPDELAFSPDGSRLGSIALGGSFVMWDVKTGSTVLSLPCATWSPSSFSFSPDGTRVSIGLGDGSLREYAVADGRMLQEWTNHPKDPGHVRVVRYHPEGRMIAYSAEARVLFKPIKP